MGNSYGSFRIPAAASCSCRLPLTPEPDTPDARNHSQFRLDPFHILHCSNHFLHALGNGTGHAHILSRSSLVTFFSQLQPAIRAFPARIGDAVGSYSTSSHKLSHYNLSMEPLCPLVRISDYPQ